MEQNVRRDRGVRDPSADMASPRIGRFGLLPSLLEEFFEPAAGSRAQTIPIPLDIEETPNTYVIRADVPGVDKSEIGVDLYENTLTISTERKEEHATDGTVVWRERAYGKASRSVQLPQPVDDGDVQASFTNGTLRLVLTKRSVKNTRRISIE